jgi:hypothetical protein
LSIRLAWLGATGIVLWAPAGVASGAIAPNSPVTISFLAVEARAKAGSKRQSGTMGKDEGKVGAQKDGQWIIHEPY